MTPLFAYGTLCRDDWRRAILGGDYRPEPATLDGYERAVLPEGYLTLRERGDAHVRGVLLVLDERALRRADAWEEVPRYARVPVTVRTADGDVAAWSYLAAERAHAQPCALGAERWTALDDEAVEAAIASFALSAP